VLTALLFAGFAFLFSQRSFWSVPDTSLVRETVMRLLPDAPRTISVPPPEPFIAHLIRPHAETMALPTFTIASDAPAPRAALPVTATRTSPQDGGAPQAAGTAGQVASANGSGGNGNTVAACLDPAWMRAVTEHVHRFFYRPLAAGRFPMTGLVYLHFIVARDGTLLTSDIGKSSGSHLLDEFALDILHRSVPLPAIPERMHASQIDGVLPMDFGGVGGSLKASMGDCH
jgi:protein TonB